MQRAVCNKKRQFDIRSYQKFTFSSGVTDKSSQVLFERRKEGYKTRRQEAKIIVKLEHFFDNHIIVLRVLKRIYTSAAVVERYNILHALGRIFAIVVRRLGH